MLRSLARGLGLDPDELIRRAAGLTDDADVPSTEAGDPGRPAPADAQKQALLGVINGFLADRRARGLRLRRH